MGEKAKSFDPYKMLRLFGAYLMWIFIIGYSMFEDSDALSKKEGDLAIKFKRVNEGHEVIQTILTSDNKRITTLKKDFGCAKRAF